MSTLDNFAQRNIDNTIENQLRKHFIDLREGNGWQVVRVYKCEDDQYKKLEQYTNYYGTYVIETIALHDIDGTNKHGHYNKCTKDDVLKDYIIVLTDGKTIHEMTVFVPAEKKEKQGSTAITIHGSANVSYTGYTEIVCRGSQN